MNEEDVMKQLKSYCGMSEVYHKKSFGGYRKAYGKTEKVTVDILDRGPEAGDMRYSCVATTGSGETVTGSPYPSIKYSIISLQSALFELSCNGEPL